MKRLPFGRGVVLALALAVLASLGLIALVWATGTGSSEAQQGTMHDCPQEGKWSIAVWDGDDGTDAEQALATCGEGVVAAAYGIDPETQVWSRYFAGRPEISNLTTLNSMQGVVALGGEAVAQDQELRVQMSGEPTSLDPQIAAFANDIAVIKQLFRGLLWYDEDLNVVPAADTTCSSIMTEPMSLAPKNRAN